MAQNALTRIYILRVAGIGEGMIGQKN